MSVITFIETALKGDQVVLIKSIDGEYAEVISIDDVDGYITVSMEDYVSRLDISKISDVYLVGNHFKVDLILKEVQ